MKKMIFLFCLLAMQTIWLFGQKPGDDYAFSSDFVQLKAYDPSTNTEIAGDKLLLARRGQIFTISKAVTLPDKTAGYYFMFWPFNANGQQSQLDFAQETVSPYINASNANGVVFFISTGDLTKDATTSFTKKRSFAAVNAIVLPIKLRFHNSQPNGDFSFEQNISLGGALSLNFHYGGPFGNTTVSGLLGLNITNVSVDSLTAPKAVTSKTTLLGLTPFAGIMFTYKDINISALCGLDVLTGKAAATWVYRNSPWLGISVGISLTPSGSKKTDDQTANTKTATAVSKK